MGTVENRPRRSTLNKIGKIFGVSEHKQEIPHTVSSSNKSSSPSHSNTSSSNSSSTSLNQFNVAHQNNEITTEPSKPSRAPSVRNKLNPVASDGFIDDFTNLKIRKSPNPTTSLSSSSDKLHIMNNVTTSSNNGNANNSTSVLSRSSSSASNHPNSANTGSRDPKHLPRFVLYEDGNHEHHLKNAKRQEKLSHMLKNLLGAQKLRDEAISAVPEILTNNPPSLFSGLVNQMTYNKDESMVFSGATRVQGISSSTQLQQQPTMAVTATQNQTFAERYGRCQEVVGKGTFGVVRISHKKDSKTEKEKLFAVKEFKRKPNETDQKYSRRLTSEFCISSSLKHTNIIETLDLLQDAKGDFVEVMEYCSGGDLYTLIIAAGKLEYLEADCFFKQLIRGVVYMHEMGVAHRDLKPENLLLTETGVLKITDFGNGECFKMAWEEDIHLSGGICGSSPYIAPEEYIIKEFDPRSVDIWACGVIYMAMRTGRHLWRTATSEDEFYVKYLEGRKSAKGYEPIEALKRARCRNVIYSILDPLPNRRINGKQILNSEWGREIKCCI